jgi:hypothetical protein
MASESGVLPVPENKIVRKWRLQPGKMFLIDLEQGRMIDDDELKSGLANSKPYKQWIDNLRIKLDDVVAVGPGDAGETTGVSLLDRQQAFGFTQEDIKFLMAPMAAAGEEALYAGIKAMRPRGVLAEGRIDYLDLSLWDYAKEPVEEEFQGRSLMSYFADLPRGEVRVGCAGKIMTPDDARACLDQGMDYVLLGRAAILHHDWPKLAAADPHFKPIALPVSADHLRAEGLGPAFVKYMSTWKCFVAEPETEPA